MNESVLRSYYAAKLPLRARRLEAPLAAAGLEVRRVAFDRWSANGLRSVAGASGDPQPTLETALGVAAPRIGTGR